MLAQVHVTMTTYFSYLTRIFTLRQFDDPVPTMAEMEKSQYEKAKELLTGYLNERLRVTISDGRVIDGRLICTDRDCNLVLSNCEEFLSSEEMSEPLDYS